MAHVGIERLATGDGQEHTAEHQERKARPFDQHGDAVKRVKGIENIRIVEQMIETHDAEDEKPDRGDRREQRGDTRRALVLEQEQRDENAERQGHDKGLEVRVDDIQPFDGGEHRHGGRYHRVAEEERSTYDAHGQNEAALFLEQRFNQHDQRKNAAFALVVGAHQEHDIFERDDEDQGPDQQRGHAQYRGPQIATRHNNRMQRFAHGIERTGADVAENNADRCEGQFDGGLRRPVGLIVLLFHGPRPVERCSCTCCSAAIRPSRRRGIQQEGR